MILCCCLQMMEEYQYAVSTHLGNCSTTNLAEKWEKISPSILNRTIGKGLDEFQLKILNSLGMDSEKSLDSLQGGKKI